MATTVFLSHAGADTAEADRLRKRLEEAGFKVWFDKRNLRSGREVWQKQIEDKIDQVDAFVAYVGSRGVVNWVEAETRYALSRAISGKHKLAFVPVLSASVESASKALPGFARQFQAVRDPLSDPVSWNNLVDGLNSGAPPPAEKEPFFGLDPIKHDRSHLFFGRRNEIGKIVDILADRNLLLVLGDSGAGKSSLVRAGLVPAWQGNEVGVRRGEHPGERDWLTITMTPGDDPWGNLAGAVRGAAESERGLSATAAAEYSDLAKRDDPSNKMRAMRLNADPNQARVLLLVDQFEELFVRKAISTETRRSFIAFLAELANPTDPRFAVALTMRGDYSNYLNEPDVAPLKERIEAKEARARYFLRSILLTDPDGDAGKKTGADRLREVVTGPLALARVPEDEANALADLVLGDTGGAPSDLALVQFALSETWEASGGKKAPDPSKLNLLGAYVAVGRVAGALAKAADRAVNELIQRDIATEEDVWAALIRLGGLEGASPLRRTAQRSEFTESRWAAIQYLASQEGRRLVHIAGEGDHATAEIAHEALLTQWGRLNGLLSTNPEDKRLLHNFVRRAREAEATPPADARSVSALADALLAMNNLKVPDPGGPVISSDQVARFVELAEKHSPWLTKNEAALLDRSKTYANALRVRERRIPKVLANWVSILAVSSVLLTVLSVATLYFFFEGRSSERAAARNAAAALAGLSEVAIELRDGRRAAILSLASLSQYPYPNLPQRLIDIFDRANAFPISDSTHNAESRVPSVVHLTSSGDLVSGGYDGSVSYWERSSNQLTEFSGCGVQFQMSEPVSVTSIEVHSSSSDLVAGCSDGSIHQIDLDNGAPENLPSLFGDHEVTSLFFLDRGNELLAGGADGSLRLIEFLPLRQVGDPIVSPNINWSDLMQQLDIPLYVPGILSSGAPDLPLRPSQHLTQEPFAFTTIAQIPSSRLVVVGDSQGGVGLIDLDVGSFRWASSEQEAHSGAVTGISVSPDGDRIASVGEDGSLRFWQSQDGAPDGVFSSTEVSGRTAFEVISISGSASNLLQTSGLNDVEFLEDGRSVMIAGRDGYIRVLDARSGRPIGAPLIASSGMVLDLKIIRDDLEFVSAGTDGFVRVWDFQRHFGVHRISMLCDALGPILPDEVKDIEDEYQLSLPPICDPRQRAILLSEVFGAFTNTEIPE